MKKQESADQTPENDSVMELIRKSGIPVKACKLYQAVDGEDEFSITSAKPSRRVEMFYTPIGLVLLKKSETVIIPPATVAYFRVKSS